MRSKKGVELSATFLVTMILALVIFVFGVTFVVKIFTTASDAAQNRQDALDNMIGRLKCDKSEKACAQDTTIESPAGEQVYFFFNVRNLFDDRRSFKYYAKNKKAYDDEKNDIDFLCVGDSNFIICSKNLWPEGDAGGEMGEIEEIEKFEEGQGLIDITVPEDAPLGTYVIDVTIQISNSTDPNQYYDYDTLKLYLKVVE